MKRIISIALTILTVVGCFTCFVPVSAAPINTTTNTGINYNDVLENAYAHAYESAEAYLEDQIAKGYMQLMARYNGYELYCNIYTGEVAYVNIVTGQTMTTNPVNFADIPAVPVDPFTVSTITKLLSQVEVSFEDNEGKIQEFYSFVEAASRNQISVKYMANGFRVEYTMGRLNTSYLVPGVVEQEYFQEFVLDPIETRLEEIVDEYGYDSDAYEEIYTAYMKITTWYGETIYDDEDIAWRDEFAKKYPKTYVSGAHFFYLDEDSGITERELVYLENLIKTYCQDIDQDLLDEMHARTGYVQDTKETPVFRVAIEYVLEDDGLSVRLPANSIRFDETKYTLRHIKMLQYFGAGNLKHDGYVFYPDGSGALIEFNKFYSKETTKNRVSVELSGSVYGEDFAYYDISTDSKHSETIRVPVFGVVDTQTTDFLTGNTYSTGFLAILEEGDALADIAASFGASMHNYASAYTMFYPRPSDTYNMSEAISVADNKEMTIVSDKKYTGSYVQKYVMLFDETQKNTVSLAMNNYYHASYVGMAAAYRDYLYRNGVINRQSDSDVEDQLPLYIETLGSVETVKKVLSIPVNTDVPLASFTDVESMYNQLAKKGITNINFKLTGYANGGMNAKYPKKLKWMKAVGGKEGFINLLDTATEKGFGVYPEFEFSYVSADQGGIRLKKNAARAVDDRYCSKQIYDPVYQEFNSYFDICVSPSSILTYVEKFDKQYISYAPIGISVSSLGSDLNSDFNKDNSLNREDSKEQILAALEHLDDTYASIMASGGNIYSVKYLEHILDFSIDSSNYKYETKTVPFLGMVLHSYANYAGSVINEAGDGEYQLLKAIENGSLLYYMLIYQNSNLLKEDVELSKFYSVRFDIWFATIVEQYNMLNGAIGDLQLYNISNHAFLKAERIPLEAEEEALIEELNKMIVEDLEAQFVTITEAKIDELFIKQTAKNLILAGETDASALTAEVARVLCRTLNEAEQAYVAEVLAAHVAGETLPDYYGASAYVTLDRNALTAAIESITGKTILEEQIAILDAFEKAHPVIEGGHAVVIDSLSASVKLPENKTESFALDAKYKSTLYTDDTGNIVMVTYQKGLEQVHFVLNYNLYDVTVRLKGVNGDEAFVVPSFGFQRINGTTLVND